LIITAPENMEGLIVSENIKVYYRVPYIQLKEFYSQSRFVILPVKDNSYSGGTTTLLEAMALAKAVIVSYTGGIKKGYHLRHNGNCFLVTPGNVEELKEAIQYLYSHPEECFRIGSNARRSVEVHNSWNIYVNRLVGIFKEVYK
jgi:glycosyltransferase involved in cell wall biosynthesis